jgi:hypothetical protein
MFTFPASQQQAPSQPQPLFQQQQQAPAQPQPLFQQQQHSFLPTIAPHTIAPQPFPRDTPFESLPVEVRNSLETLERTVRSHTLAAKRLETARDYLLAQSASSRVHEERELVGRVETKQQSTRTQLNACRRSIGQFWRYGEAVSASLGIASSAPNVAPGPLGAVASGSQQYTQQPTNKYANLQLPPYDLQLFERIVDRLDGLVLEAELSACALRQELEWRAQRTDVDVTKCISSAILNQQISLRELKEKTHSLQGEVEDDRRAFRRFLIKYRNDSSDPFVWPKKH